MLDARRPRAERPAASEADSSNGSGAWRPEGGDHLGRTRCDRQIHRAACVGAKFVAIELAVAALPLCPWSQGVLAKTAVVHVGFLHDCCSTHRKRICLSKVPPLALIALSALEQARCHPVVL